MKERKNLNYSTLKKHFQELPGSTLHYHQGFVVSLKSEEEFFPLLHPSVGAGWSISACQRGTMDSLPARYSLQ